MFPKKINMNTDTIKTADLDRDEYFPSYIHNTSYDLRKLNFDNINTKTILSNHRQYTELDTIYTIKNISDAKSFIQESIKNWEANEIINYVITKKNNFKGYVSISDINWDSNTAIVQLYTIENNRTLIKNVLYTILHSLFKNVGLSLINIRCNSKNNKTEIIDDTIKTIGGSFDGRFREPIEELSDYDEIFNWSVFAPEFYKNEYSYTNIRNE